MIAGVSWRRLLVFAGLFAGFYYGLASVWAHGAARWVIDFATVQPAAALAKSLTGDATVVADGPVLRSASASIKVLAGCEGTDVSMLLVAAMLVAPIPWRWRLAGVLAGTACAYAVNQLRLLGLFVALRERPDWFGPVHGLVAPVLVVASVALFFLLWLRLTGAAHGGSVPGAR